MKSFLLALLAAVLLAGCAPKRTGYLIEGHVRNIPDSSVICLGIDKGNVSRKIARDTVRDGRFRFEGVSDSLPALYVLSAESKGFAPALCKVWICNNRIRVTGDCGLLETWDVKSDLREQKDENRFICASKADIDRSQQVMTLYYALFDDPALTQEQRRARQDSLSLVDRSIRIRVAHNDLALMNGMNPGTVWIDRLTGAAYYARFDPRLREAAIRQYERMDEERKASAKGESIRNDLYPKKIVQPGDAWIDATLYDPSGRRHTLSSLKGGYLLLDFWSVGCQPCLAATPELEALAAHYGARLQIVGINVDQDRELWANYCAGHPVPWPNLSDGRGVGAGVAAQYNVSGIPHYVLVAPDGTIADVWSGYGKGSLTEQLKRTIKP